MTSTSAPPRAPGLSGAEVRERVASGQVNRAPGGPQRTVGDIVRANVLTRFNFLLGTLLVVVLFVAPVHDALFGFVLVSNTAIGIVQEVRAKRTLDRLALLHAPRARVVRDGEVTLIPVDGVVVDDLLVLEPGDQLVVDAELLTTDGLELDESLLTGEAQPVVHQPGDTCLSGSFVVAGTGTALATRVGGDAYAAQLAQEARRFGLTRSELRAGVDQLLRWISWLLVPTIPLLTWTQLRAAPGLEPALAGAVAGSVAMVPEGLVLLTSVAFAVSVVRLGRRQVLVQELAAVETLARVDVVCFDKTGTLTCGRIGVQELVPIAGTGPQEAATILGAVAAADPAPNATAHAIRAAHRDPGWAPTAVVPFSSARAWSAVSFAHHGTYVLGAPDVLLAPGHPVLAAATAHVERGRRVVLLARTAGVPDADHRPGPLRPLALVVLGDRLRPDAAETLAYFVAEDVRPIVLSGDHPRTVAALARSAGLDDADPLDGHALPDDPDELAALLEHHQVLGRVTPQQKRDVVAALRSHGHVVAVAGDGVNDVLAIKDADLGIAMGSGSAASRAVAQAVLLDASFAAIPDLLAEGRRVTANIERVANLFVTKTVYAFLLVVAVGAAGAVFPFLPRHLTLVGSVTIGIPAFFLALEATSRRYRPGFLVRVARFAVPVGTVAAAATFGAYWLAQQEGASLEASRTVATLVLGATGLYALVLVSRPWTSLRHLLVVGMGALLGLAVALPAGRDFFALHLPRPVVLLAALGIVGLTGVAMFGALAAFGWLVRADVAGLADAAATATRDVAGWTWERVRPRRLPWHRDRGG